MDSRITYGIGKKLVLGLVLLSAVSLPVLAEEIDITLDYDTSPPAGEVVLPGELAESPAVDPLGTVTIDGKKVRVKLGSRPLVHNPKETAIIPTIETTF